MSCNPYQPGFWMLESNDLALKQNYDLPWFQLGPIFWSRFLHFVSSAKLVKLASVIPSLPSFHRCRKERRD